MYCSDSTHSYKSCKALAQKVSGLKNLPNECLDYKDIVQSLVRKETTDSSIAFQGMGSSAAAAASARERGQQNYAQVQRRFTNTRRFTKDGK